MKTSLSKGLDDEQKRSLSQSWKEGLVARRALHKWAETKIDAIVKEMVSKDAYKTSNWGYLQADSVAYIRALEDIKTILLASEELKEN